MLKKSIMRHGNIEVYQARFDELKFVRAVKNYIKRSRGEVVNAKKDCCS